MDNRNERLSVKKIIIDIDNTLYDYETSHSKAMLAIKDFFQKEFSVSSCDFEYYFNLARKYTHINLSETASSHNRLLYFQRLLELTGQNPLKYSLELYDLYWDVFIDNILLYDGVIELFEKYSGNICFLTDLTADIQHKKILRLNLYNYSNCLVTSEEAGREKPHPYIFLLALEKLKVNRSEVVMIGDSFGKDIVGAYNVGIRSIWLNSGRETISYDKNMVFEVNNFSKILELL